MLRPADWLPPKRLLTPRLRHRNLSRPPGVCYSALRRLPRRDLHPLETKSVNQTPTGPLRHDAPRAKSTLLRRSIGGTLRCHTIGRRDGLYPGPPDRSARGPTSTNETRRLEDRKEVTRQVAVSDADSVRARVHLSERCFRPKPVKRVPADEVHVSVTQDSGGARWRCYGRSAVLPDDSGMHLGRERPPFEFGFARRSARRRQGELPKRPSRS